MDVNWTFTTLWRCTTWRQWFILNSEWSTVVFCVSSSFDHTQETQRLMAEPVPGITATPDEGNARYFHVVIAGPQDSPFEGGTFKLELFLPEEYPMAAPKVRFMTKIYHPNVDKLGRICLDILKGKKTRQKDTNLSFSISCWCSSPRILSHLSVLLSCFFFSSQHITSIFIYSRHLQVEIQKKL